MEPAKVITKAGINRDNSLADEFVDRLKKHQIYVSKILTDGDGCVVLTTYSANQKHNKEKITFKCSLNKNHWDIAIDYIVRMFQSNNWFVATLNDREQDTLFSIDQLISYLEKHRDSEFSLIFNDEFVEWDDHSEVIVPDNPSIFHLNDGTVIFTESEDNFIIVFSDCFHKSLDFQLKQFSSVEARISLKFQTNIISNNELANHVSNSEMSLKRLKYAIDGFLKEEYSIDRIAIYPKGNYEIVLVDGNKQLHAIEFEECTYQSIFKSMSEFLDPIHFCVGHTRYLSCPKIVKELRSGRFHDPSTIFVEIPRFGYMNLLSYTSKGMIDKHGNKTTYEAVLNQVADAIESKKPLELTAMNAASMKTFNCKFRERFIELK